MLTILFDGIAYGMLLFVLACGLAVTLGLMNFVNLAHGAFAMAGGYVTVVLINRLGVPFLACAAARVPGHGARSALRARAHALCPRLRQRHLDQVLFTIGLVFMSVAAVDYVMGSSSSSCRFRSWLQGQVDVFGVGIGSYRLFIIVICGLLTIALQSR